MSHHCRCETSRQLPSSPTYPLKVNTSWSFLFGSIRISTHRTASNSFSFFFCGPPPLAASLYHYRIGLLVRLGIVYTFYLLVVSSYLTYLNYKTPSLEYLTGALQFLMVSQICGRRSSEKFPYNLLWRTTTSYTSVEAVVEEGKCKQEDG